MYNTVNRHTLMNALETAKEKFLENAKTFRNEETNFPTIADQFDRQAHDLGKIIDLLQLSESVTLTD